MLLPTAPPAQAARGVCAADRDTPASGGQRAGNCPASALYGPAGAGHRVWTSASLLAVSPPRSCFWFAGRRGRPGAHLAGGLPRRSYAAGMYAPTADVRRTLPDVRYLDGYQLSGWWRGSHSATGGGRGAGGGINVRRLGGRGIASDWCALVVRRSGCGHGDPPQSTGRLRDPASRHPAPQGGDPFMG